MTASVDCLSRRANDAISPSRRSLAALLTLALALRLIALGRASPWYDELLEVERASLPWRAILFGRPIDQDPPLLALALRGWIAVGRVVGWPWLGPWTDTAAGTSPGSTTNVGVAVAHIGWAEAWLRLPSVALGVAAVALTAVWATRWFGRRVGLLSALLLALSPLAIYDSQEVNQYAAMIAATPLLLLLHERVMPRSMSGAPAASRPSTGAWIVYGAVSAAALATHYGLVFPLLALGIDLAWRAWRASRDPARRGDRRHVVAVAAYALWCAAVIAALFALGLGSRMALPHVQPRLWGTHFTKELAYIGDVGWREIVVYFPFPFAGGPAVVVADVLGVLALVGAVRLWRRDDGGRGRLLVGGYVGGTLAMTYATSVLGWYPLGYRYGVFNLVPFFVLVAAGVVGLGEAGGAFGRPSPPDPLPQIWGRGRSRRRGRVGVGLRDGVGTWAAVGVAVVGAVAFVAFWPNAPWTAANPYLHVPREDARSVLRDVAAGWRAGDRLVVYDGAAPAVRFYWRGAASDVDWLPPFSAGDPASEARVAGALGASRRRLRDDANGTVGRMWVVVSHIDQGDEGVLRSALANMGGAPNAVLRGDGAEAWRYDGGR